LFAHFIQQEGPDVSNDIQGTLYYSNQKKCLIVTYETDEPTENGTAIRPTSETIAETPDIARCDVNQSVTADSTTLVR